MSDSIDLATIQRLRELADDPVLRLDRDRIDHLFRRFPALLSAAESAIAYKHAAEKWSEHATNWSRENVRLRAALQTIVDKCLPCKGTGVLNTIPGGIIERPLRCSYCAVARAALEAKPDTARYKCGCAAVPVDKVQGFCPVHREPIEEDRT